MTVVVAVNVPDGVIIGADSTNTLYEILPFGRSPFHYGLSPKLFSCRGAPVCIASYGLSAWHQRTIGSFVSEFESQTDIAAFAASTMTDRVEQFRVFMAASYEEHIKKAAAEMGLEFEALRGRKNMTTGFVVGGYSSGSLLTEVWHFQIPEDSESSAHAVIACGDYRLEGWALSDPIHRLIQGFDPGIPDRMTQAITDLHLQAVNARLPQFSPKLIVRGALRVSSIEPSYGCMSISLGVEFVHFLLETTANYYRFVQPIPPENLSADHKDPPRPVTQTIRVEGPFQIGTVTHREDEARVSTIPAIQYGRTSVIG